MRAADRVTTGSFILREFPRCGRIVVLCGGGNNRGDGFVACTGYGKPKRLLSRSLQFNQYHKPRETREVPR